MNTNEKIAYYMGHKIVEDYDKVDALVKDSLVSRIRDEKKVKIRWDNSYLNNEYYNVISYILNDEANVVIDRSFSQAILKILIHIDISDVGSYKTPDLVMIKEDDPKPSITLVGEDLIKNIIDLNREIINTNNKILDRLKVNYPFKNIYE